MRWLAIHLHWLPLELFARGVDEGVPLALAERRRGRRVIRLCNPAAAVLGVRPGIGVAAARALGDRLCILDRDGVREAAALHAVAAWCGQFSSEISLTPPRGLVLEVAGSLRLFGGIERLQQRLREGLQGLGYRALLAQAPTPGGAALLARAGIEEVVADLPRLRGQIAGLSLTLLPLRPDQRRALLGIGVTTFGELLRLPREGLARRLGTEPLRRLARLLGEAPDPRPCFVPPEQFHSALELPAETLDSNALLFAAQRLLAELHGFLRARGLGTQRLEWGLDHGPGAGEPRHTRFVLGLMRPERDPGRLRELLQERLQRVELQAPVRGIQLEVRELQSLQGQPLGLFADPAGGRESTLRLLERLRARLGSEAVAGLGVVADHRPERAAQRVEPGEGSTGRWSGSRPLWLLAEPRPLDEQDGAPLHQGRLRLEPERERIEGGWWDGRGVARDYFIAYTPNGERLWVFRELGQPGRWFLHGFF